MGMMNIYLIRLFIILGCSLILINSCRKLDQIAPINFNKSITYGNMTDQDGNIYKTVTIGTQIWMAENLKTTRYNNGELIGTTTPAATDISGESTPGYQWAYDGNESNVASYGRLYTWYTVNDSRNLCPTGWHVPSDAEWTILTTCLGGESVAGGKLKETGTTHWQSPNTGATNETGFTALPGGLRYQDGTFDFIGGYGYWWSSTQHDPPTTWERNIYYNFTSVLKEGYFLKTYGFSVRCIKDN